MHLRPALASSVLLSASLLALAPAGVAGAATTICTQDSYSEECVREADKEKDSSTGDDEASTDRVLPFTGGELVLMTGLGAGALAAGTALVVAGRRKSTAGA